MQTIDIAQLLTLFLFLGVFAWMGYKGGTKRWLLYTLGVGAFYLLVVDDRIRGKAVTALNGLYVGVVLVKRGGLSALGTGNVQALMKVMKGVHRPLSNTAVAGVVIGAVIIAVVLIVGSWSKLQGRPSIISALLGAITGYLVASIFAPTMPSTLPAKPWQIHVQSQAARENEILAQVVKEIGKANVNVKVVILGLTVLIIVLAGLSIKPTAKKK